MGGIRSEMKSIVAFSHRAIRDDFVGDEKVPMDLRTNPCFVKAFKRGLIFAFWARLESLPPWYTGEETKHAYRRGWKVGRKLLERVLDDLD